MNFNKNTENYFELFGLPVSYKLDLQKLEQVYFALQREFHPDKYIASSGAEKLAAAQKSITINDGYKALKDNLHRAEYILFLNDIIVNADKKEGVQPCMILLAEAMEMRENLLEAETVDEVQKLEEKAKKDGEECLSRLTHEFAENNMDQAAQLATRMRYLEKLEDEIRIKRLRIK